MPLSQPLMNPGDELHGFVDKSCRFVKIRLGVGVEVGPLDILKGRSISSEASLSRILASVNLDLGFAPGLAICK
jgi:hypothetical protein